jgi:hypothetical protein
MSSQSSADRQVVFAERFKRRGWHRIAVIPADGSGAAAVDAFVVLG